MVSCWPRWLVIFSLTVAFAHGRTSETLKVQLSHGGTVVGRYLTTVKGRGMRAFMGVPYAKPPVGELRFMVSDFYLQFSRFISKLLLI